MSELPDTIHKTRPILFVALFLTAGVFFGRFHTDDPLILLLVTAIFILTLWRISAGFKKLLILITAIGFAIIWSHDHRLIDPTSISPVVNKVVQSVTAEVIATESVRRHNVRYLLEIIKVNGETASGTVRWFARNGTVNFTPLPGDIITITNVKLRSFRGYQNIGAWDFEQYMKDRNILASIGLRKTSMVTKIGEKFRWRRPIEKIKNQLRGNLTFESDEVTALGRAILIGDQGMITPAIRDIFSEAGVSHILAVSGLHIGFIALACFYLARGFFFSIIYPIRYEWASGGTPTRIAALVGIAAVIFYAALTGPRVPSARAAIMASAYLGALFVGRSRDFYGAFSIALILIVLLMPYSIFQAGFQLSFVVVFAIVIFMEKWGKPLLDDAPEMVIPPLYKRLLKKFPLLGSFISLSIFAAIGSTPLAIYHFNIIPTYSVLLNSVLVPITSLAVPFGLFASTGASEFALFMTERIMNFIWMITSLTSSLPISHLRIPSIPAIAVALYYMIILTFLIFRKGRARRRLIVCAIIGLALSLLYRPTINSFDEKFTLRFVDVGQGDSAVITWPKGGAMVIDSGMRYPTFDLGRSIVAPVLWRSGRTTLSALILTHSDQDHMGGAFGLAKYVVPKMVMDNGFAQSSELKYFKLRGEMMLVGRYRKLVAGDEITLDGGLTVKVLSPPAGPLPFPGVTNNRSLVLKVTYGNTRVLFTADIGKKVEQWLIDSGADIKADIIKIAHHGSNTSTSARFLKAVGAKVAVISLGYKNRFRHPSKAVLKRLKNAGMKVYRTDIDGEIVMKSDGGKISIGTYASR